MNGKTIAIFRKTHNLKQEELAELTGSTKSTISSYERGYKVPQKWFKVRMEQLIQEHGIDWNIDIPGDGKSLIIGKRGRYEGSKNQVSEEVLVLEPVTDNRPHADHYHAGKIDVWAFADENYELLERIGFHRINALKYVARFGKKKGYNHEDLDKAIVELQKLKELTKQEATT